MASYSEIPEEILVDIVSRLPAKSVGQCRCVSKSWRSLLSQPSFIRAHLSLNRRAHESLFLISRLRRSFFYATSTFTFTFSNAHHLFDQITFLPPTRVSFPNYPDFAARFIPGSGNGMLKFRFNLGSCNGLLLVSNWDGHKFVLNPVTRDIREIPSAPCVPSPHKSSTLYGFGYDAVHDDYKVVAISCYYDKHRPYYRQTFVHTYSLKLATWKSSGIFPYGHDHFRTAFVEGCIHWLGYKTPDASPTVLAFDLAHEELCQLPTPSSDVSRSFASHIAVLDGCLCMYSCDGTDIWVMKEYGVQESWINFTIDTPYGVGPPHFCMLGPEQLLLTKMGKCTIFNLKEGTSKEIVVRGIAEDFNVEGSFVESLVSPHGATGK